MTILLLVVSLTLIVLHELLTQYLKNLKIKSVLQWQKLSFCFSLIGSLVPMSSLNYVLDLEQLLHSLAKCFSIYA